MSGKRDTVIEDILKGRDGCVVRTHVPLPRVSYKSVEKNRMLCRTNTCGNFNRSWTCPPNCGSAEFCIERVNSFRDADILMKRYENVDLRDAEGLERLMDGFRDLCRDVLTGCRKEGYDVLVLADGPCSYCKECAIEKGKKCYHPEMQVPSVSGYGIDMTSYMKECGIEFSFEKDAVTLYGVVLFP